MPEYESLGEPSGCSWRALTNLERRLIILSTILAIITFGFIIAFVARSCDDGHHEPTTLAPSTRITTPIPTNATGTTLKPTTPAPTNATQTPSKPTTSPSPTSPSSTSPSTTSPSNITTSLPTTTKNATAP